MNKIFQDLNPSAIMIEFLAAGELKVLHFRAYILLSFFELDGGFQILLSYK